MILTRYIGYGSQSEIELPESMKLAANFTLKELANNLGDVKLPKYLISEHSVRFNAMLQQFRTLYGKSIEPTSGYRQAAFNKKVGGSSNSMHLYACACDFVDKYNKEPFTVISYWLRVLAQSGIIGAVNIYNEGSLKRYHVEAFSDVYQDMKVNTIRVYSGAAEYAKIKAYYYPLGFEVIYYGQK